MTICYDFGRMPLQRSLKGALVSPKHSHKAHIYKPRLKPWVENIKINQVEHAMSFTSRMPEYKSTLSSKSNLE